MNILIFLIRQILLETLFFGDSDRVYIDYIETSFTFSGYSLEELIVWLNNNQILFCHLKHDQTQLLNIPPAIFSVILSIIFGIFVDTEQPLIPLFSTLVIQGCYAVHTHSQPPAACMRQPSLHVAMESGDHRRGNRVSICHCLCQHLQVDWWGSLVSTFQF